ncbi:Type II secretion system protein D precursor [Aquisphaera giovannonii]|uniref:Type II secretion system protein D n=1 Tax=Aquisphaera giovannonii TaxID=406548 RepID=A0A5B9W8F6_9BACT|nr:pilus assembly protein N-terminal domain-containing protein [Aquisphaera giovannonii]QEH36365.1 Type II secretion system protein D precursor [Aquisphaera giovannonii]
MTNHYQIWRRRDVRSRRAAPAAIRVAGWLLIAVGSARAQGTVQPPDVGSTIPLPPLPQLEADEAAPAPDAAAPKVLTPSREGNRGAVPPPPAPAGEAPRGGPPEPIRPGDLGATAGGLRVIPSARDATGLVPGRPPGTPAGRPADVVRDDLNGMVKLIQVPEAEISVVLGESRIVQTRKDLVRVVMTNPNVADVEILAEDNAGKTGTLLNISGKQFGNTTLTIWDDPDHAVSFLVRVTLDAKELEGRINQAFPGAQVKVRQIGMQLILEGQVPDSKMMSDILQVAQSALMTSRMARGGAGGMSMAGMQGGGMAGGASGGMAGGAPGGISGMTIVNRVIVPGPRQVLLHCKIAELNRQAIRQLGISWLNTKGKSIIGSSAGGVGGVSATAAGSHSTSAANPIGFLAPISSTFSGTGSATSGGQLFGVFDAGHFSLFINALRNNSLAKILAEPNLVALDGQPARFLVGGRFPFPVPQSSSIPGGTAVVTVQLQQFGTILNFLPQVLANDVIRLDVEPEISNLDFSQGTFVNGGQVPAIIERSARTVVELREGQTLAIAGLLQLRTTADSSRIPGLGDLPLVGPWFSSNQITTIETETIILVTPELVSPLEKNEVTEAPGDRVYQPSDAEFYFLGRIEGKLGREFRATVADKDPLNLMKHFQSEQRWVSGPHGYAD